MLGNIGGMKFMVCAFCKEYRGLGNPCTKDILVKDLNERGDCEYYNYNGECKMRVIERTSAEVDQETVDLFNECKPYLDKGCGFHESVRIVKNIKPSNNFVGLAWYKRFRDYAISQGYKPLR